MYTLTFSIQEVVVSRTIASQTSILASIFFAIHPFRFIILFEFDIESGKIEKGSKVL